MIKRAFRCYAFASILSPWAFFLSRIFGLYNNPSNNSWIFIGLFLYSGLWVAVLFWTYKDERN